MMTKIRIGILGYVYLTASSETTVTEFTSPEVSAPQPQAEQAKPIQYVAQWPSGFPTDHELYQQYSAFPSASGDANHVGYIYWHWCRGDYKDGPINRTTAIAKNKSHDAFHAYFSTEAPDISGDHIYDTYDKEWVVNPTPDGTYHHPHACCQDTYWFYVVEVVEAIPAAS